VSASPAAPTPGARQRLLLRVERFARVHWRLVFLISIVTVVTAGWLGSRLRLESDVLRLVPRGHPQVDAFRQALEDFGSIDYLMVLLESDGRASPEVLEDFSDVFAERLAARDDLVERVEYRFQPDERFLELFYENALLFLSPDRLEELGGRLTDAAIRSRLRDHSLSLASPTTSLTEALVTQDPLDLLPLFVNRLLGHRGALKLDLSDGYYLSTDGRTLILLVKPRRPAQDLAFDRQLLDAALQAVEATRAELAEGGDGETVAALPAVSVRFGGTYALALQESELIFRDARFNLLFSLCAVAMLYWVCYRRVAALLYSSVPLMVGQAMTFAVAYLALGQLNSASSSFTALLMGLGTDFTIVMYARYVEERQRGLSMAEATEAMVGQTGLGVFTGAITSAGTFYAMCLSRFRGLFDLGFLIGSGILLCAVAIVFLLPAMISWNEGSRRRRSDPVGKLHLQGFGIERLIPFSARHPRVVITVVLAMAALGLVAARGLVFDDSLNALRSNRTEAARVQQDIATTFDASLSYMMVIARGADLDAAVARAAQVEARLAPFLSDGTIGSYDSVLTYLPPAPLQQAMIDAVRRDGTGRFDVARVRAAFLAGLEENGFRREAFDDFLRRMERFLEPQRPLSLKDLQDHGLGQLLDRYIRVEDGQVRIVTYLFPTDARWKREVPPGLVEALAAGDPEVVVTGSNVVGRALRGIFTRDVIRAVSAGLAIVFVLLLIDFRSLKLTLVAMAQLLTGVAMMLGAVRVLGFELNYVNAFVSTMILGVGIDYGIHLIHRLQELGGRVEEGLLETGKAVVIAAMTNMAGFGTLMLGNYPALRSFGAVALCGSLGCLLTSLTLVPALLARRPTAP
jgi:hypothetical protein